MKRCAIYTRKSTEEGLEQHFNSLDAQREACVAFIKSQKHEGWRVIKEQFDDGGFSGATADRPALQALFKAVKRREIDVVVVYKVDRLTRSLADFAKIVEVFDAHSVSFVSVTQQFNTTSSMGRLTLNVLLSFAQFEREVTAERIRDKIAASKKKGMWMGGPVPLGYDARDRKLAINKKEAEIVQDLFRLYLECSSVRRLKAEADLCGHTTKHRASRSDRMRGGKPFSRGNLYLLLSNPIYVGRVSHRGTIYPGQHEAIIDDRTWEDVQTKLRGNAAPRRSKSNTPSPTLLTGLLFDDRGDLLCPTHAVKRGRRYRYYVSKRIAHGCQKDQTAWRLPAAEIDGVVRGLIIALLSDPRECGRAIGVTIEVPDIEPITKLIRDGDLNAQRTILQAIIDRIDLAAAEIAISIKRSALIRQLGCGNLDASAETIFRYVRPIALRRRGVERKVVLCNGDPGTAEPDPMLCKMIGRAHLWHKQLARHDVSSVEAIALREVMDGSDVSRILQLAFLAPDIVEAILAGRQPHELTARALMRMGPLPSGWQAQRQRLGFAH